jgi:hypothetical protein
VPIVNAVRITSNKARQWVVDTGSIATHGRWEGVLEAGEADDFWIRQRIGQAHLASRAQPSRSIVAEVVPDGLTFSIGDFVSVAGEPRRVVGITRRLNANGDWDLIPEFETIDQLNRKSGDAAVSRLTRTSGSPVAAPVRDGSSRSTVETGRISDLQSQRWSWTDLADIEPGDWQVWSVDRPCRITDFAVECDTFETVDGVQEKVTIPGQFTSMTFTVNGQLLEIPPIINLNHLQGSQQLPVFAALKLRRNDRVRIRLISDGGHINGSVTLRWTDIV